jgi:Tfp pilus assembly protein PilV
VNPRGKPAEGFAMLEVLIALLLFAVALLGSCASLVHGMRAAHSALLLTRAVDLAADLAEDVRGLPAGGEVDAAVAQWHERVGSALPVSSADFAGATTVTADPLSPQLDLWLRWRDPSAGASQELQLPAILATGGMP